MAKGIGNGEKRCVEIIKEKNMRYSLSGCFY